jgi:hypothetical protein
MNVIRVFLVHLKVIKGQWRNARKSAVANTSEVEPSCARLARCLQPEARLSRQSF